jgi:hypothetical protein
MMGHLRTYKQPALMVAFVTLGCALAFLAIGPMRSTPLSNAGPGVAWQCSTSALILTTCTKVSHTESAFDRPRKEPVCLRRA